eukprot:5434304-Amphidinium_carterae.2
MPSTLGGWKKIQQESTHSTTRQKKLRSTRIIVYEEGTYPEELSATPEVSVAYWAPTAYSPPPAKDHPQ